MNGLRVLTFVLLLVAEAAVAQQGGDDPVMAQLMEDLRQGEAAEAELRRVRDRHLADISTRDLSPSQKQAKLKGVLDTYRQESSKLVARYRQPLIEELKARNPGLKDSMGTSLYLTDDTGTVLKDAAGKPKLNPDFRGWSGDHDLQGSPAAVHRVRETLGRQGIAMTGAGASTLKDLTPGDLSAEALEMTINLDPTDQRWRDDVNRLNAALEAETDPVTRAKLVMERNRAERAMWAAREADSMLKPGSSAHETVAQVAASSKETYVVASMENGQVGRQAVAVNDHYKKAVSGFAMEGAALMDPANEVAFQGMVKGTGKAITDAGLSDADIARAMKGHGLMMTPEQYRSILKDMKQNPVPELYNLTPETMESFRRVNMAVMDEALSVSGTRARQDLETRRTELRALDDRITAATGEERARLATQRERLGREYVDTQVKLQAVEDANASRRATYGLAPSTRQTRPQTASTTGTPELSNVPAKGGLSTKQLGKAMDGAGKIADFVEIVTTTLDEADKAVSEASPHDSDAELIVRVTANATLRLTGVTEAAEQAFTPENMQAFNKAAIASDFGASIWEFGKLAGKAAFNWVAKKADDAIITPLKNIGEATVEGVLLGEAVAGEVRGALRNLGEQTLQQIRLAMHEEEAVQQQRISEQSQQEIEAPISEIAFEPEALPSLLVEQAPAEKDLVDVIPTAAQAVAPALTAPDPVTLTQVILRRETYDGVSISSLPVGQIAALTTVLSGTPPETAVVEWFLDGRSYKKRTLTDDKALGLRLDTTGMAPGSYGVRVEMTAHGSVIAQADGALVLIDPMARDAALGVLSAHRETYDGAALVGAVENGQIVAFNLPVALPQESMGGAVRWQVFGPDQVAIAALVKEENLVASGTPGFRFRPEGLPDATYEVRATFLPAQTGQTVKVASTTFVIAAGMAEPEKTTKPAKPASKPPAQVSDAPLTRPLWNVDPAFVIENSIWTRFLKMPNSNSRIDLFEDLAWTTDGTVLMLTIKYEDDSTSTALYTAQGDGQAAISHARQCTSMTFSQSSLYCQLQGESGRAKLAVIEKKTGRSIRETTLQEAGTDRVLALSPTGDRAAYIPPGYGFLVVYNTVSGAEEGRHSERPPKDVFDSLAYDKKVLYGGKGHTLLMSTRLRKDANGQTSNHLELLDGFSGGLKASLLSSADSTYALQGASPDGRYALVLVEAAGDSKKWSLFDLASGQQVWTISNLDPNVTRYTSPVVVGNEAIYKYRIFNPGSKEPRPRIEIYAFDIATGVQHPTLVMPISDVFNAGDVAYDRVVKFAINPDGRHIAAHLAQSNGNSRLVVGTLDSIR